MWEHLSLVIFLISSSIVEFLADVAPGRTDEKGVTENQQQQPHPELFSQLGMKPFTAPGSWTQL